MLIYEKAFAKVNLTLSVLGVLPDGYHNLASLVVFTTLADEIEIELNVKQSALVIEGEFASTLSASEDNLIFKAMDFLGITAKVKLIKNIPVASGLGGGSADLAAFVRSIGRHLAKPKPTAENLFSLGADVPACYEAKTLFMSGAGEKIKILEGYLPELFCVLACQAQAISTAEIFAKWDYENKNKNKNQLKAKAPLKLTTTQDVFDFCNHNGNDLLPLVPQALPLLAMLKKTGAGAYGMSGSGASCFGLYEKELDAKKAALFIKQKGLWTWHGKLLL